MPSQSLVAIRGLGTLIWREPTRALEGRKEGSPGQAERSPGLNDPLREEPRRGERMSTTGRMDLSPFQRYFLVFPGTPGCAPLARGYLLPPPGGFLKPPALRVEARYSTSARKQSPSCIPTDVGWPEQTSMSMVVRLNFQRWQGISCLLSFIRNGVPRWD